MNTEIAQLKETIRLSQDRIIELQNECPHPKGHLWYKYCGSSGGWDYDASYWLEWKCTHCEKRWTTDQTRDEIQKYPHANKFAEIVKFAW